MQPKSNIKQTNIRHFDLRKNLTTFWLSEHITVGSWSEHVSSLCRIHGMGKSLHNYASWPKSPQPRSNNKQTNIILI
jgi:hypothetical protein